MADQLDAINLELTEITDAHRSLLSPITSISTFTPSTNEFDPNGLFSTEIFGKPGTEERSNNMAYIDLGISVIHPKVTHMLFKARTLYQGIMSGEEYAVFDKKTKDFIKSDINEGNTGMAFFISHLKELVPEATGSESRKELTTLLKIWKTRLTTDILLVIPAALREYTVGEDGKPSKDEINGYYVRLIALSKMVPRGAREDDPGFDTLRYNVQLVLQEIFLYITKGILFGKYKYINQKVNSRRVHSGTKSVMTSIIYPTKDLDSPALHSPNHTVVGLFLSIKAAPEIAIHAIRNGFMYDVFPGGDTQMNVVDKKTLQSATLPFDNDIYKKFMTEEGLTKLFNIYQHVELRDVPLTYKKNYIGLIWEDFEKKEFRVITGIEEGMDNTKVRPLTLTDIFYLSAFHAMHNKPETNGRYPVMSAGGIYVSKSYIRPTENTFIMHEVDASGSRTGIEFITYPDIASGHMDVISPSTLHIGKLKGDYDGDTFSKTALFTREGRQEAVDHLNDPTKAIDVDGALMYSPRQGMLPLVLASITGDPL